MLLTINESVTSDICNTKGFLENILKKIKKVVNNESLLFDIRLILSELVINGVIHGNCKDNNKKVNVSINVDFNRIVIEVTDQGKGFEYSFDSYDPYELKCSGRGLIIVNGLSDEFYINKNRVVSIKYF